MNAKDWECSDCGVKVRFDLGAIRDSPVPVAAPSQPAHWVTDERGWHCLRCQREAAVSAPAVDADATPAQQRRRALVEFELLREPTATDTQIARRAKCTAAHVTPVRADLVQSGKLQPERPS